MNTSGFDPDQDTNENFSGTFTLLLVLRGTGHVTWSCAGTPGDEEHVVEL